MQYTAKIARTSRFYLVILKPLASSGVVLDPCGTFRDSSLITTAFLILNQGTKPAVTFRVIIFNNRIMACGLYVRSTYLWALSPHDLCSLGWVSNNRLRRRREYIYTAACYRFRIYFSFSTRFLCEGMYHQGCFFFFIQPIRTILL